MRKTYYFCLLFLLLFCFDNNAFAKTNNRFVNWNYIDFRVPLTKISPKLFFIESISPRLKNNLTELDVVVLRSQLGYQINPSLTLSLGHDWRRRFNTLGSYENRIWQQIDTSHSYKRHGFNARLRLEERIIENHSFRLRLRPRIGYSYQLTDTLTVELSDEMLFAFIGNNNFEQNRILLNFRKQFNDNFNLNLGYQLQHYFSGRNLINHALVTRFEFFF